MMALGTRRSLRSLALGLSFLLGAETVSLSAVAQQSAQDKAELKRLRSLFQQGIELEHAGNWGGALQIFREVGQSKMTPQVRYHIALCEEKLALAEADSVGEDFRTEVQGAVAALRNKIPMLTITRGPGADAATIEVDNVTLGEASVGQPFPVDPGPHAISAKSPGYKDFIGVVELGEAERRTFVVKLEPRETAPTSRPIASASTFPDDPDAAKRSRVVPYVVGGVGVAALVASGVLFGLRQGALSDLEDACNGKNCDPESKKDYDRLTTYHYGAQVALGIGVVGVGTAVALILLEPKPKAPPRTGLRVLPELSPESAGLHVHGAF
jgi:hypothetical protein